MVGVAYSSYIDVTSVIDTQLEVALIRLIISRSRLGENGYWVLHVDILTRAIDTHRITSRLGSN